MDTIATLGRELLILVALNVGLFLVASIVVFVVGFARGFVRDPKKAEEEKPKKRQRPPYETTREAPAPPPRELEPKKPGTTKGTGAFLRYRNEAGEQVSVPLRSVELSGTFTPAEGAFERLAESLEDRADQERALRELLHDVGGR